MPFGQSKPLKDSSVEKVFGILMDNMEKVGLLPKDLSPNQKEGLILQAMEVLKENGMTLTPQTVFEPKVINQLSLILLVEHTKMLDPKYEFKYEALAENSPEMEKLKLELDKLMNAKDENEIKTSLEKVLKLVSQIADPELKLKADAISALATKIALKMSKEFKKHPEQAEEEKSSLTMDIITDELTQFMINLYGHDPRRPGIVAVVTTYIGNLQGIPYSGQGDPNARTNLAEENTFNFGKADPTGKEQGVRARLEALGIMFAEACASVVLAPTPNSPLG